MLNSVQHHSTVECRLLQSGLAGPYKYSIHMGAVTTLCLKITVLLRII